MTPPDHQRTGLLFHNATAVTPLTAIQNGAVLVRDHMIEFVGRQSDLALESLGRVTRIDCQGGYIAPGFIDIHVHGGGGGDVAKASATAFDTLTQHHARGGTTSLLATLLSSDEATTARCVAATRDRMGRPAIGAQILGMHLEGPFISPAQAGAQNPDTIRAPRPKDIEQLQSWADVVRLVTAAPETPGGLELGRAVAEVGIIPSIGHSDAYYPDVVCALEAGYRSVTHLFCKLSQWKNEAGEKTLGASEAALLFDELFVELIADGKHVSGPLLQLALKNKGASRICLVTDSIWAAGLEPGTYDLGGVEIVVSEESARLADDSANAGSVATMDRCLRTMVKLGGATLEQALQMASLTPARLLGIDGSKGSLVAGMDADLVVLDTDLSVMCTVVGGRVVHDSLSAKQSQRN